MKIRLKQVIDIQLLLSNIWVNHTINHMKLKFQNNVTLVFVIEWFTNR